jgi:hypothetical protein
LQSRTDQFDLAVVEWSNVPATHLHHAHQLVLDQHRRPEQRPNGSQLDHGKVVVGVSSRIPDMHRLLRQGDAASQRLNARPNRVQPLILHSRSRHTSVRLKVKQLPLSEMNQRIFGAQERGHRLGNLVEDRLQTHVRPRQILKYASHGLMAITKLAQLPHQLSDPGIARSEIRHT